MNFKNLKNDGITSKIPEDGIKTNEYIKQVQDELKPKDYFIPCSIEDVRESGRLNIYTKDKYSQVVLEYYNHNNTQDKENLIKMVLATGPMNTTVKEVKELFSQIVKDVITKPDIELKNEKDAAIAQAKQRKSKKMEEKFAKIRTMGWNETQESLDFATLLESDGKQELLKTEFIKEESTSITKEDIDENKLRHRDVMETELIELVKDYIIERYEGVLPQNYTQDTKVKREKVLNYKENRGKDVIKNDTLSTALESMKPIKEPVKEKEVMQRIFAKEIDKYIDAIPISDEDIPRAVVNTYIEIRNQAIEERESDVGLEEDSNSINRLNKFIDGKLNKMIEQGIKKPRRTYLKDKIDKESVRLVEERQKDDGMVI